MKRNRGNAMIEFALGATVLVMLFTGAFQYGYAFFVYNHLQSSVAAAARYASTKPYNSNTVTPEPEFTRAVCNMAVYGNPVGGETPIAPGLSTANVRLSIAFANGAPADITVDIDGYELNALFQTFRLKGKPAATFPYLGTPEQARPQPEVHSASLYPNPRTVSR